jgi:hypothetical protein
MNDNKIKRFTSVIMTIAVFILASTLSSFTIKNPATNEKLNGKVKSLIHIDCQYEWSSINGSITKECKKEVYQFNINGNVITIDKYYSDTFWHERYIAYYNEHWRLLETDKYKRDTLINNGILESHHVFQYDALGRSIGPSHPLPRRISNYTPDGTKIISIYKENDSTVLDYTVFQTIADSIKKSTNSKVAVHDKNGNILEEEIMSYGVKTINKYDKLGNLKAYTIYNVDGSIQSRHVLTLNTHGNIIADNEYNADSLIDRNIFKYTYDKIGNWTVDSTFDNDTLTYIRTQQFEYW